MKISCIFVLLYLTQQTNPAYAKGGDADSGDRPRSCNNFSSNINSCIEGNKKAAEVEANRISELKKIQQILWPEMESYKKSLPEIENQLNFIYKNQKCLELEIADMSTDVKNPLSNAPIFLDKIALEKIFSLPPQSKDWLERFPSERSRRLFSLKAALKKMESQLNEVNEKNIKNYNELEKKWNTANAEIEIRNKDLNIHRSMYSGGCKAQYCPD